LKILPAYGISYFSADIFPDVVDVQIFLEFTCIFPSN
jgi:hypothetical protein